MRKIIGIMEYWKGGIMGTDQKSRKTRPDPSVVSHKFLFFVCHSGLDPESSVSELDSRFRGNDDCGADVKKR